MIKLQIYKSLLRFVWQQIKGKRKTLLSIAFGRYEAEVFILFRLCFKLVCFTMNFIDKYYLYSCFAKYNMSIQCLRVSQLLYYKAIDWFIKAVKEVQYALP